MDCVGKYIIDSTIVCCQKDENNSTDTCFSSAGTDIIDLGAAFIHGPSEENPVFRVARHYGLLSAEALTEENQSADVSERPPMVSNWFSCSGRDLLLIAFIYLFLVLHLVYIQQCLFLMVL